jgi:hypothetical protein
MVLHERSPLLGAAPSPLSGFGGGYGGYGGMGGWGGRGGGGWGGWGRKLRSLTGGSGAAAAPGAYGYVLSNNEPQATDAASQQQAHQLMSKHSNRKMR